MPTETYTIDYVARDQAIAITRQLEAEIAKLDATAVRARGNLSGFAGGAGRSAAAAIKQLIALNVEMAKLATQATSAKGALNGLGGQTKTHADEVGSLVTVYAGMRIAEDVFEGLVNAYDNAKLRSEELAENNLKLLDTMRELAGLQKANGPDDAVAGNALLLGIAAGMKPADAVNFLEQFEGSVPAGEQMGNVGGSVERGEITQERQDALKRELAMEGAMFGSRVGLDAATAGDLTGVITQYTRVNSAKDMAGQQGAIVYGLNEGRGNVKPLARSLLGASAALVGSGHVEGVPELAAMIGVASTVSKGPGSSGTTVTQMDALLNTAKGKGGSEYLDRIGASRQTLDLEKLRLVKADLEANSGGDWSGYLKAQGFGNQTEIRSTVAMAKNFGVLEARTRTATRMAGEGGTTMEANRNFLSQTTVGQNRQAEAAAAAADYLGGREKTSLIVARKAAYGRLKVGEGIDTADTNTTDWAFDSIRDNMFTRFTGLKGFMGGNKTQREERLDAEVQKSLVEGMRSAGMLGDTKIGMWGGAADGKSMDIAKRFPGLLTAQADDATTARALNEFGPKLQAQGIDPTGGSAAVVAAVKEVVNKVDDQNKLLREQGAANAPGKPAVIPKR